MTGKRTIREKFVEKWGNEQADRIVAAALEHNNEVHNNPGDDVFQWALVITIGFDCWSMDTYRDYHKITVPEDELRQWIKDEADLANYTGDPDYIGLLTGKYEEYMK